MEHLGHKGKKSQGESCRWGVGGGGLFLAGMGNSYWKRLQAQKGPSGLPSFCAQSLVPDIRSVWI